MAKLRAEDNERVKQGQTKRKLTSMSNKREKNNEKVKINQTGRKHLSMGKKTTEDNKKVKRDQNTRQRNHRSIENASDGLKDFKEATKYNAISFVRAVIKECSSPMSSNSMRALKKN